MTGLRPRLLRDPLAMMSRMNLMGDGQLSTAYSKDHWQYLTVSTMTLTVLNTSTSLYNIYIYIYHIYICIYIYVYIYMYIYMYIYICREMDFFSCISLVTISIQYFYSKLEVQKKQRLTLFALAGCAFFYCFRCDTKTSPLRPAPTGAICCWTPIATGHSCVKGASKLSGIKMFWECLKDYGQNGQEANTRKVKGANVLKGVRDVRDIDCMCSALTLVRIASGRLKVSSSSEVSRCARFAELKQTQRKPTTEMNEVQSGLIGIVLTFNLS